MRRDPGVGPKATIREAVGAIHIHTCRRGVPAVPALVRAARRAGCDFVVVTDSDDVGARPAAGWRDGVLVAVGVELSPKGDARHLLALGGGPLERAIGRPYAETLEVLREIGAVAFAAHPWGVVCPPLIAHPPWSDLDDPGLAGAEIWSFAHDLAFRFHPARFASMMAGPLSRPLGPSRRLLLAWDEVLQRRPYAILGSLDARLYPGRVGETILATILTTLRTHVWVPPPSGDAETDLAALVTALAAGRSFIAFERQADARGFRLEVIAADGVGWGPGDAVERARLGAGARIDVGSPMSARLRLLRDGRRVAEARGRRLVVPAAPGVWRAEARLGPRPWVYTNAVRILS